MCLWLQEKKEETGPGDGKQSEPELVAKDDNEDKTQRDDDNRDTEEGNDEEEKEKKPNELDMDEVSESALFTHNMEQSVGSKYRVLIVIPMNLPSYFMYLY